MKKSWLVGNKTNSNTQTHKNMSKSQSAAPQQRLKNQYLACLRRFHLLLRVSVTASASSSAGRNVNNKT